MLSLEEVELMSIKANRDGLTIELTVTLNEFTISSPHRWYREADAVALSLQLGNAFCGNDCFAKPSFRALVIADSDSLTSILSLSCGRLHVHSSASDCMNHQSNLLALRQKLAPNSR